MRVFLDTNVIVSALATRGLCADLVQAVLADHDLLLGHTVMQELRSVLARKMGVPSATLDEIDAFLRAQATLVIKAKGVRMPPLDPADSAVLAEAIAAGADVLVSGDRHLLELPAGGGVRIASPRAFWEILRAGP